MPEISPEAPVPDRWSAAAAPGQWMDEADDPRFTGEDLTGERSTLIDYLRAYRITLELKCADLDAEQLAWRSVPPSTMSLLGLIRHMAQVERSWFQSVLAGLDTPKLYTPVDADWDGAVADPEVVAEAWQSWRDAVDYSVRYVADADDLGIRGTMGDGDTISLREVLVHMIEEYARHCGHADLLRERIDGRVGA